ncbi:MAG: TPM domain-containing protein [Niabella sp.]
MFSFFNKRKGVQLLTTEEKEQIVQAIRNAESRTSGEIRVYMERKCKYADPVNRAGEIFFRLKMHKTDDRNAVLLYVAVKDHQLAVFGDEGIYQKTGKLYWEEAVQHILRQFNKNDFVAGISGYVYEIGEALAHYFPYNHNTDKNELPDEIVFGNGLK